MAKSVKINGVEVPCENFIQSKLVCVGDELMYEVTYIIPDHPNHRMNVLVAPDKWRKTEKTLRKNLHTR